MLVFNKLEQPKVKKCGQLNNFTFYGACIEGVTFFCFPLFLQGTSLTHVSFRFRSWRILHNHRAFPEWTHFSKLKNLLHPHHREHAYLLSKVANAGVPNPCSLSLVIFFLLLQWFWVTFPRPFLFASEGLSLYTKLYHARTSPDAYIYTFICKINRKVVETTNPGRWQRMRCSNVETKLEFQELSTFRQLGHDQ